MSANWYSYTMRINKLVAQRLGIARRKADELIEQGRISINGVVAKPGSQAEESDAITYDGKTLADTVLPHLLVAFNKPVGYVCSRRAQGRAPTIYSVLPKDFQHLNPIGRLDKDSSGLLLLTNDGDLANRLSHPSFNKNKVYQVTLNKALLYSDELKLEQGVALPDGISKLALKNTGKQGTDWQVTIHEGRNRQIRRTFAALGYGVAILHRTQFGPYQLNDLPDGETIVIPA